MIKTVSQSCKKRSHYDNKSMTELSSYVNINTNPPHGLLECGMPCDNQCDNKYDDVINDMCLYNKQEVMRMKHSPLCGGVTGYNNGAHIAIIIQHSNASSSTHLRSTTTRTLDDECSVGYYSYDMILPLV